MAGMLQPGGAPRLAHSTNPNARPHACSHSRARVCQRSHVHVDKDAHMRFRSRAPDHALAHARTCATCWVEFRVLRAHRQIWAHAF
eukprot:6204625-Pleurochrysis_carterae.AAC.1